MEELYLGVLLHGEGEHGELVVQPPAGDGGSGGGVGASHDPGGGEAQGVLLLLGFIFTVIILITLFTGNKYLVCGEGVPDQQLPILSA